MKLTDLYLSDEQLLNKFGETLNENILNRDQRLREVVKASTNHAVKKVVEELGRMNLTKNHPNCFMIALEDWEALKELVEELDKKD